MVVWQRTFQGAPSLSHAQSWYNRVPFTREDAFRYARGLAQSFFRRQTAELRPKLLQVNLVAAAWSLSFKAAQYVLEKVLR
jgi:hypothetical protein